MKRLLWFLRWLVPVLIAAFSAPIASAGQATYAVTEVPTLGGSENAGYAINNRGDVVGWSRLPGDDTTHSFLYTSGTTRSLSPLNSGRLTTGSIDINERLQIASGVIRNGVFSPAILDIRTGQMTILGSFGGVTSYGFSGVATAINDRGDAVGYSYIDELRVHAFLYSGNRMIDLTPFVGSYSAAYAINKHGDVVGEFSDVVPGHAHAFLYRNGHMKEIDPFGGPNNESRGRGINDAGQIVGEALTPGGVFHGFVYDNGSITDIGTLVGGRNSVPYAINKRGDIVGIADKPYDDVCFDPYLGYYPCVNYAQHGFLYQNGVMTELNALIGPETAWDLNWAFDINDKGQITGYGLHDGLFRAFILTPVQDYD